VQQEIGLKTIGIVGGGVVGLCCAVALLDRGYGVSVFERDADYNAASWGNAGHIAVEQVEPLASPAAVRSVPKRLFSVGGALGLPVSMAAHCRSPHGWWRRRPRRSSRRALRR
jgi:flavin-dependent dehydrogenase